MHLPKLFRGLLAATALVSLTAHAALSEDKPLRIGVTAGPHAQIFEFVKKIAEKDGLKLQIVEFSDYVQPNAALAAGDLDVNSYQHQPYLDNANKDRGYKLVSIGQTIIFPIGLYSKKFKSLDQVPNGARLALPNDPTNGGRALLLLQKAGLLKLKDGVNEKATLQDIAENPKNFKFQEVEAAQVPRTLDDVDAAIINTNFAMQIQLDPTKDSLFIEDSTSPYVNIVAVRQGDENRPEIQALMKVLHSQEIKDLSALEARLMAA